MKVMHVHAQFTELCSLQEQLSRHLEELQAERSKTEAHIQSLKKRNTDLSVSRDPDADNT